MSVMIEKELRGPINPELYDHIRQYAAINHWKEHTYKQITIYCNTDVIPSIGTVTEGKGRLILDIRDDYLKIKIKVGNALSFSRKEYVIKCQKDSYESVAVLLKLLGVSSGFGRTFDRTDFITNNGIQLTVKLNCNMGDHFELERNDDDPETLKEFNDIINDLSLYVWNNDEYASVIQHDHETIKEKSIIEFLRNEI